MSQREYVVDIDGILRILPCGPSAVLLDRVVEVKPGARILAEKQLSISDPAFDDHFPRHPVYPPGRMIEVMLQACTVLVYATEQYDPQEELVTLVGVNKTKLRRSLMPGDTLEIEAELVRRQSNVWRFDVTCYVDDYMVAESGLVISLHGREDAF
jgi:3-hydroxyacyl-[acyl-carrier-protein] dehydratase